MKPLYVVMLGASLDAHGGVSAVERLIVAHRPDGVSIRHIPTVVEGSGWAKARTFLTALIATRKEAGRSAPDLFYLHVAVKGSVFRKLVLAKFMIPRSVPLVLHTHGGDFDDWYRRQGGLVQSAVRQLFHRASRVVALSESWATFYRSTFELRDFDVAVLPNPVACPPIIPDRSERETIAFAVLGSMDERKGAFRALDAFAQLPAALRDQARLVIAGNGRVDAMRERVRAHGLERRVTVHDWLGPKERDALLAEADVYVLPSLNEGLPMGMLEAMGWGLAVITSPVGGIPEVIRHEANGLLVAPRDERQLVDAMGRLIVDRPLRLRLGRAARESARRLDVEFYWPRLRSILSPDAVAPDTQLIRSAEAPR